MLLEIIFGQELIQPTFPRFVFNLPLKLSLLKINLVFTQHKTDSEEVVTGEEQVHEFKTETKRLLDIVANSLYSEKEIFVR